MIPAWNNLAVSLFLVGDYAEAWQAVRACRRAGFEPSPEFVAALSARMSEPAAIGP
jgi:hypothetical protein